MMQELARVISRLLKGRTLTATFTEDISTEFDERLFDQIGEIVLKKQIVVLLCTFFNPCTIIKSRNIPVDYRLSAFFLHAMEDIRFFVATEKS